MAIVAVITIVQAAIIVARASVPVVCSLSEKVFFVVAVFDIAAVIMISARPSCFWHLDWGFLLVSLVRTGSTVIITFIDAAHPKKLSMAQS